MRFERSTSSDARVHWALHDLLERTAEHRLAAIEAIAWRRVVMQLAASGDWLPIKTSLAKVASGAYQEYPHHLDDVLGRLVRQGFSSQVWSIIAEVLVDRASAESLALLVENVGLFDVLDPELVMQWIGAVDARAIHVAELLTPRAPRLEPAARELIRKLGADHEAATILARHARMPHGFYGVEGHLVARIKLARQWCSDDDPEVRRWAAAVAEQLEHMDRIDQTRRHRA